MKSLTRMLLLVALASVVALPVFAAPAHAAKKMEAALQDDGVFIFNSDIGRENALASARFMGATTIRMNILWWQAVPVAQRNQATVPSNIAYNFSAWDTAIARARGWGMKVQLDLAGDPPAWACGSGKIPYECDGFKPKVRLWKGFVKAAAKHFKGQVKRYSMWNEPNWYTWLSPHKKAPLLYRKLVQTGYKQVKRVDKKAEVVAGELAPHFQPGISTPPLQFIREMVCVNKKLKRIKGAKKKCGKKPLKFDAFATHPYDFEHKPKFKRDNKDELTVSNLDALPKLLTKLRKKGLIKTKKKKFPIYLTEHGYMVQNPAVKPRRRIPESKRKRWIVQAWKIAQGTPRIKQMLHYDFVSPRPGANDAYFDMGLLTSTGDARASYTKLRNWILDAVADGKVARPGPCTVCG
jgi:hypothetical protein